MWGPTRRECEISPRRAGSWLTLTHCNAAELPGISLVPGRREESAETYTSVPNRCGGERGGDRNDEI